jgi:hypothetical protein
MSQQPQSNANTDTLQSVKQLVSAIKNTENPNAILQAAANQNPQIAQVMSMVNGSGMNAKQLFMMAAQQRGVDPNQIVNMLK